jgi:hypothetical protein
MAIRSVDTGRWSLRSAVSVSDDSAQRATPTALSVAWCTVATASVDCALHCALPIVEVS